MTELTLESARERCDYWQARLRLRDWLIELSLKHSSKMAAPDCFGTCNTGSLCKREARIELQHPQEAEVEGTTDLCQKSWDWERTLVHELLHLHFCELELKKGTRKIKIVERAIDALSKALLEEQRAGLDAGPVAHAE